MRWAAVGRSRRPSAFVGPAAWLDRILPSIRPVRSAFPFVKRIFPLHFPSGRVQAVSHLLGVQGHTSPALVPDASRAEHHRSSNMETPATKSGSGGWSTAVPTSHSPRQRGDAHPRGCSTIGWGVHVWALQGGLACAHVTRTERECQKSNHQDVCEYLVRDGSAFLADARSGRTGGSGNTGRGRGLVGMHPEFVWQSL